MRPCWEANNMVRVFFAFTADVSWMLQTNPTYILESPTGGTIDCPSVHAVRINAHKTVGDVQVPSSPDHKIKARRTRFAIRVARGFTSPGTSN